MTWVANVPLTAAQLNTFVRDNFNETAPGRATTAGSWFITTGRNAIAERVIKSAFDSFGVTVRSSNWSNASPPGPIVVAETGAQALVWLTGDIEVDTTLVADGFSTAYLGFEVTGATSLSPSDERALSWTQMQASGGASSSARYRQTYAYWVQLTAGSNTFTAKYRINQRGPTADAFFFRTQLAVVAL